MKAVQLAAPGGLDNLKVVDIEEPGAPGPGQIRIRAHASSLNFHDYMVVSGHIPAEDGRVPMSDVSGIVEAVGDEVTEFHEGDQVIGGFFPRWQDERPTTAKTFDHIPGDTASGYAQEIVVADAAAFTRAPRGWNHQEAACLPCAGVTAWRALKAEAKLKPDDVVLTLGTGGVSIFALQMAKAAGHPVISTSSSDAKLEKLEGLGADHLINYQQVPEWGETVRELTGGEGADHVIEVGGPGTLTQSIMGCRVGGNIVMVGVLTGRSGEVMTAGLVRRQIKVHGIAVGSREHQLSAVEGVEASGIKPIIDKTFPLEEIADAFRYQESQGHFGKICLSY